MSKKDKNESEPSLTGAFEVYNEELAPHIVELRQALEEKKNLEIKHIAALKQLNSINKEAYTLKPPTPNIEGVNSLPRPTRESEILTKHIGNLQQQMIKIDEKIKQGNYKTFGRLERDGKIIGTSLEELQEQKNILDEKINPSPYKGKSPIEAKKIRQENKDTIPVDSDYFLKLIQNKKEKDEKKAEIKQEVVQDVKSVSAKANDEKKSVSANFGYQLNYQLKYQKPVFKDKEQTHEKLEKDFSKNKKEILKDRG